MTIASIEIEPGSAPRPASAVSTRRARWLVLFWTLVRTDFKARYHGSWSGFVWALLKPLSLFVVLMSVFSLIFASDPTYKLDLIVGLFLWDFFAEGTKSGLVSLHAKGFLLTKARCPSWILVVASIANALITLAVFCVVIVLFLVFAGRPPTMTGMVLFLGYCGLLTIITVGFSLGASVLFVRYRDLNQVWDVMTQVGFFIAPIIYPLEILPEHYHFYLYLWPPTAVIEFSRAVLVAGVTPTLTGHVLLLSVATVILLTGSLVFRRLSPRTAEYL